MSVRLGLPALGLATPLGRGKGVVARALFAGERTGLAPCGGLIPNRDVYVGAVAGDLPNVPQDLRLFACRNNRLMLLALNEIADDIAAAIRRFGADRIGVVLGTSTSGMAETEAAFAVYKDQGEWPPEYDYRQHEAGALSEFVQRALRIDGPAYTVTTACSSSAKVFASARRLIAAGICDAAIVGGADTLCKFTLNGFSELQALSSGLCNPFSLHRDGINIGEGAAAFLMTPDPAPVELMGVGESSDAYHASAPDPEGVGAIDAMRQAMQDAQLDGDDIDYINLHGTGTVLNDAMESRALAVLSLSETPCSSTKGMTGHLLGAAGGCEAAFLWLALQRGYSRGQLPPHIWDGVPDPALPPLNFVKRGATPANGAGRMLSVSYAFGGSNVALVLGTG